MPNNVDARKQAQDLLDAHYDAARDSNHPDDQGWCFKCGVETDYPCPPAKVAQIVLNTVPPNDEHPPRNTDAHEMIPIVRTQTHWYMELHQAGVRVPLFIRIAHADAEVLEANKGDAVTLPMEILGQVWQRGKALLDGISEKL